MQYPLTEVRRRVALNLLVPLVGERPSIVAEEPIGHEWAPVTRLTFDREIPGAAAMLAVRVQRLTVLAASGQSAHDQWRRRAQLVQQIRIFEQLAAQAGCSDTLADWFTRLASAMADRWDDATSPPPALFPAFR